jgi:hypothetical protein
MKKTIVFLFVIVLFFSCAINEAENNRFKVGETVYLKLDSTKGVVSYIISDYQIKVIFKDTTGRLEERRMLTDLFY